MLLTILDRLQNFNPATTDSVPEETKEDREILTSVAPEEKALRQLLEKIELNSEHFVFHSKEIFEEAFHQNCYSHTVTSVIEKLGSIDKQLGEELKALQTGYFEKVINQIRARDGLPLLTPSGKPRKVE